MEAWGTARWFVGDRGWILLLSVVWVSWVWVSCGASSGAPPQPSPAPPPAWREPATGMEFLHISPGSFQMGSRPGESGREAAEIPHQVTISKGFYLGKYEVTQGQWNILMGNNPSWHQQCGDDCPVEGISLVDIEEFLVELNDHSGTHLVASGDSGE